MNKKICWVIILLIVVSCSSELQNSVPPKFSTVTIALSSTPLIAPTVTLTSSPTSTKIVTSTADPILLTQEAIVSSCASAERTWYSKHLPYAFFTNELWGAVVCSDKGVYTKVSNSSLDKTWIVPSLDGDLSTPEPSWFWEPYLWTNDGKYLYLQARCLCFIDSPWLIYSSGFGLSRINLETGQVDTWLKPNDSSYSFEFTQGGELFAFSPPDSSHVIKIRDLISGEEQSLSFKNKYTILEYRWTPDKSRLVIFTEERGTNQSENGFSIIVYSMDSKILEKLVDKNNLNDSFPTEEYIGPRIYISELSNQVLRMEDVFQENVFELDIRTGELTKLDH